MEKEENVYVDENLQTESGAEAQTGVNEVQDGPKDSTVLGKFKDVDALAKAYESLQAEFTRRSQRLKELERLAENFQSGKATASDSGAEKLRKNASRKREESKAFNEFVNEMETATKTSALENEREPAREVFENPIPMVEVNAEKFEKVTDGTSVQESQEEDKAERSSALEGERKTSVAENGIADPSEALYQMVTQNESVRLKIIGEYLKSIGKSGAPLTVGGGTVASPPTRPTSIGDAGTMALHYFKKAAGN